jgi:RimJ/RimL family protein N-acetyltransferase
MSVPPTILTERLLLRWPRMEDAEAVFDSYAQDEEVTRYLRWAPHGEPRETWEFLWRTVNAAADGSRQTWAITLRDDPGDTLRGMIELTMHDFKAEVGYVLARPFWGRGLMTEALRAVVEFAFCRGLYRVWGVCDVDNTASARVMEKAGMRFEGVLRRFMLHPNVSNEPRDARCYAATR